MFTETQRDGLTHKLRMAMEHYSGINIIKERQGCIEYQYENSTQERSSKMYVHSDGTVCDVRNTDDDDVAYYDSVDHCIEICFTV